MAKKEMTQEQIVAAQKQMKQIAFAANREEQLAMVINQTYDVEYPIADVISAIMNTASVDSFEPVYYFVPSLPIKKVYILTTDCNVTHEQVTPGARNLLEFTSLVTSDYWICLHELLQGAYNILDLYAETIQEALNRYEIYSVLQLLDAAAVANGNVFAPNSGEASLTYPKLVEIKRAVRKYGMKLVMISGANVSDAVTLMQYDANKFQPVNIKDVVDEWYPIESLEVTINGVATPVINPDVAYVVAVSDSKGNRPGYFIRRKISPEVLAGTTDTTIVAKERAVIVTGMMKAMGTVEKFAKGIAGFEQVGVVITNPYTVAKFSL
jgi:hypothetical protein